MADETVTAEEISRVRKHECAMRGHTWTEIEVWGQEDPVSILCSNCGRSCAVVPGA